MKDYFYILVEDISPRLKKDEVFTALLEGEDSDFVRLNKNRIRQAGHVQQVELTLDLIQGNRHSSGQLNLSGNIDSDRPLIKQLIETLRAQRDLLEDDPFHFIATEINDTEETHENHLPNTHATLREIIEIADGLDLVGIWASGRQYQGFANSFGQRNWYSTHSFNFDWSCYVASDKAVKANYSGPQWDSELFRQKINDIRNHQEKLKLPKRHLTPGRYRCYLAPAALDEIATMMAWGGFGLKSHRTRQTPLIKMVQEEQRLHPSVSIIENHTKGIAPGFTPEGFIKPSQVTLIRDGCYQDCLVNPRSSREYAEPVNAAYEFPESLEIAPGNIPEHEILQKIGRGLYINNLWYCNFSDRNDCRITGMTRYACFWVENGEIAAPLAAMRFDDSIYRLLGDNLIGLTQNQHTLIDPDTYYQRSSSISILPGALVEDFNLTL